MMNSAMDYWTHRARTEGRPQTTESGQTILPPGGNQIGSIQGMAQTLARGGSPQAIAPVAPGIGRLLARRPTMPLRPRLDPREIQAAFLRGELDDEV
jgi:hypothetical protein